MLEKIEEESETKPKLFKKVKHEESKYEAKTNRNRPKQGYFANQSIEEESEPGSETFTSQSDESQHNNEAKQKLKELLAPNKQNKITNWIDQQNNNESNQAYDNFQDLEGHKILDDNNLKFIPGSAEKSFNKPNNNFAKYRRKGIVAKRRLSRINLGQQLALSETAELKMQWMVDLKD